MDRLLSSLALMLAAAAGCSEPRGHGRATSRPATAQATAPAHAVAGWRGDGTGRYPKAAPPAKWDVDEGTNILWTSKVGGGLASPVVAGDRIFLTAEPETLLCVRRSDGKVLWRKPNGFEQLPPELKVKEKRHPSDCGFSTATPVTDGKFVYAGFGTGIVVAYGLDGDRKWVRYIDRPQMTEYGRSASPVLADGKLLVSIGQLTALDPASGRTLWEAPKAKPGYGTPAVATIDGTRVAVTPGGDVVRLADGRVLAAAVAEAEFASPVVHEGVAYFAGQPTVAVKLSDHAGGQIKPRKLWETDDTEGEFFASPVVHGGLLYCVSNDGLLYALTAADGKVAWQKQLDIPSAAGIGGQVANMYPSIALAGGRLYLGDDAGVMLVLAPGREYKQVSENYLDEGSGASPAFAGKHVYLRDGQMLYCIGAK